MTTLRKLLLAGNPLCTLRSSLVNGPTPALLKFLQSRLPTDEDGFRAVSKLQILDLSGAAGALPENPAFSSLPELYLRRMQISAFPVDIITLQQLHILDLSQNSIQTIPETIKNLTSLTELNLSNNNISSLPPVLGLLEPNLQVLKVDGNPLRSI
ncbi:hypothetical protein ACS0TY_015184 [Phlomoides rotata]